MKIEHKIILVSVGLGLLVWVIDTVLDYFFFYRGMSFIALLLQDVPSHELYIRSMTIFFFLLFGLILARMVGQQNRITEALQASEERFRAVVNSMDDIVYVLDEKQRHVALYGRWLKRYGTPPEVYLGKTSREIMGPEAAAPHEEANRRALTGENVIYQWAAPGPEGVNHVQTSLSPLRDAKDKIVGLVGVGRDITPLVRAEEALRKANQAYKTLSECNQALVWATDEDQLLQTVCQYIVEHGEYALAWVGFAEPTNSRLVQPVAQFGDENGYLENLQISWADNEWGQGPTGTAIRTNETIIVQNMQTDTNYKPWRREAIQRGYAASIALPLRENGRTLGALNIYATEPDAFGPQEIHLLEELAGDLAYGLMALRTKQERDQLAAIVDSSNDAIIGKTLDGTIISWNKGAEKMYGYTAEEAIGQSIAILIPPQQTNDLPHIIAKFEERRSTHRLETVRQRKDGQLVHVSLTVSPVRNAGGEIIGVSSIARDITDYKRLQEQFLQAQKLEAVGRLTGGIAHDFNNLLTAINGFSELMRLELAEDNPAQAFVDKILDSGRRAANLVRQLLIFSRKQLTEPKQLNLNQIVTDMGKMLQRIIGEDIAFKIKQAPDLGMVQADPTQVEQIIVNLAVNARDAMPEGGRLTIETANVELDEEYAAKHAEVEPGQYVMLAVSDTGQGIDEANRSYIFEPFFTTKESGKGTGLGLATVYAIVKQSGGHIWFYSEMGQGTTFKIYLPRLLQETKKQAETFPRQIPAGVETILVAEDDEDVRELAVRLLRRQGYTVLEAANAETALQLARRQANLHLLLTDVVMHDMSGQELAAEISSLHPTLKILFMSGYTDEMIDQYGGVETELAFLQKPFTTVSLARKVREMLDR